MFEVVGANLVQSVGVAARVAPSVRHGNAPTCPVAVCGRPRGRFGICASSSLISSFSALIASRISMSALSTGTPVLSPDHGFGDSQARMAAGEPPHRDLSDPQLSKDRGNVTGAVGHGSAW